MNMTPTSFIDEQALELQLDSDQFNWELRGILADLLEEQGRQQESDFQRWLVKMKKSPEYHSGRNRWDWYASAGDEDYSNLYGLMTQEFSYLGPSNYYRKRLENALFTAVCSLGYEQCERLINERNYLV